MMRQELIGTVYYNCSRMNQIVSAKTYSSLGDCYLVNDKYPEPAHPNGFGLAIISCKEVHVDLGKQEEYKARYETRMLQQQRYEEAERIKFKKEQKEKEERENLYGYDGEMSNMQRGRVLKILLKQEFYSEYKYNPNSRGFDKVGSRLLYRKDYIVKRVSDHAEITTKNIDGKIEYRFQLNL